MLNDQKVDRYKFALTMPKAFREADDESHSREQFRHYLNEKNGVEHNDADLDSILANKYNGSAQGAVQSLRSLYDVKVEDRVAEPEYLVKPKITAKNFLKMGIGGSSSAVLSAFSGLNLLAGEAGYYVQKGESVLRGLFGDEEGEKLLARQADNWREKYRWFSKMNLEDREIVNDFYTGKVSDEVKN